MDLMRLYQEAAFNDPVLNSARFNYAANKEIYWQGLSTLLPQVSANPTATRFFQHGEGNSRIFDQKSYTVSLTQPVFNAAAIEVFKDKYKDINRTIPKLLELLTAKQAELRADSDNFSQPEPRSASMSIGSPLTRATSLLGSYKYPMKSDDPNSVRSEYVAFPRVDRFDVVTSRKSLQDVGILPSGKKESKITWNKDSDRFLYEFINVWLNEKYPDFVQKLNFLSSEDHNAIINRIREMASNGGYNLLSSLDDPNLDRSKEELYTLFKEIYRTIKIQMDTYTTVKEDLSGGRRRKKSRRYKKRRATQRKRRVKGRRTRKGKKRRSTKRRR
jgi:hypothetical protein